MLQKRRLIIIMVVVVVAAVVAVVCNYGPIQRTGAVVGKGGQV
jgi:hypothetical protein